MTNNQRFSINEDRLIIDSLNPANSGIWRHSSRDSKDETHFRRRVLYGLLANSLNKLIQPTDEDPFSGSILGAIVAVIDASHLNTLDPALSVQHKFGGELKREKKGMHDFTSLSRFADDVECSLRDLFGDFDNQAIAAARSAVFAVVCEFTRYLRNDVWQKYYEALDIDLGTGHHPESDGWGISVSDIECMDEAADNLARRVRAVQENPTAFSQYTVEFVRFLDKHWNYLRAS